MAERHTVDVEVVGSKPIRLPEESLVMRLFFYMLLSHRGMIWVETHQLPNKKLPRLARLAGLGSFFLIYFPFAYQIEPGESYVSPSPQTAWVVPCSSISISK